MNGSLRERAQIDAALARERMIYGQTAQERLGKYRRGNHVGREIASMRAAHVDLHLLDRMYLLAGVHLLQHDFDARIVGLEAAHRLRHSTVQHRIHEADPQAVRRG
jgi:hypothetical protein